MEIHKYEEQAMSRKKVIYSFNYIGKVIFFIGLLINSLLVFGQTTDNQYTLGSGDEIRITVFGQEDLTVETTLSNVGVLRYPFLGDISLVGKTVNEVERIIDAGLRGDYLVNPSVSVTVLEYRPFFVDGEVNRPGGFPWQPGLTIDRAAALAGGYTERASKSKVIIRRNIGGEESSIEVGLNQTILPGDIVTVQSRFF